MKKYLHPEVEIISIDTKETFLAYAGCEAVTWLTGTDAGEYYCGHASNPDQIYGGTDQCYNSPVA